MLCILRHFDARWYNVIRAKMILMLLKHDLNELFE